MGYCLAELIIEQSYLIEDEEKEELVKKQKKVKRSHPISDGMEPVKQKNLNLEDQQIVPYLSDESMEPEEESASTCLSVTTPIFSDSRVQEKMMEAADVRNFLL
ncbi:hypothetical protein CRE_23008 [Caenorhabditis remanei]|uniref:Uncharacterized protein n=1 Tax=Caenorhabditis remanei TaxID=31234 RepID=E3N4G2_CAERE|nr:hypothetical protein CRE_23008 [Caenorhabditis remanei]